MDYISKKRLSEEEKEKKRAHYRAHREEILAYQHSEEYVQNRKAQRRGNKRYNDYHKFDMQERRQDEDFKEMCNESRRKSYRKNAEIEKEKVQQYQMENYEKIKEYKREYMREYMRRKRAAEKEKEE